MALLSPGVEVVEIDASAIVPTVSNSIGVFCGNFVKGPTSMYLSITNVDELISIYGEPTNENYNEWYQCYNFLQYGNTLYISRAANIEGTEDGLIDGVIISANINIGDVSFSVNGDRSLLEVGMKIRLGNTSTVYTVTGYDGTDFVTLDKPVDAAVITTTDDEIRLYTQASNATNEAVIPTNDVYGELL